MRNILRKTLKLFSGIMFSGLILFLVLNINNFHEVPKNVVGYFQWFSGFIIGDYGISPNDEKKIIFSLIQVEETKFINIGPQYIHSVAVTLSALIITFIISLFLNTTEIVFKNKKVKWLKVILEWLSSVHIIIFGIILFILLGNKIPLFIGIFMVAIFSNAFNDLSAIQYNDLNVLCNKDFVIAARSWGDDVWKHMKRTVAIDTINQFSSMWLIVFTNTLIYEIICQKRGLGYELFFQFLEPDNYVLEFELDLFMTLTMFIIITLFIINYLRDLMLDYLIFKRR